MEQGSGSNSNGHAGIDKSRVLDVRPLRILAPVFPNTPGMSSVTPSGPFPSGVQPFFPFLATGTQQGAESEPGDFGFGGSIPAPVPLNSFRTPTPRANGSRARARKSVVTVDDGDGYSDSQNQIDQYGDVASNSRKRRGRSGKGAGNGIEYDVDSLVESFMVSFKLNNFDEFKSNNSEKDIASAILLVFNLIRRRLTQLEEAKDPSPGTARRPDLKTGALLMNRGVRANHPKKMGQLPGIEVGDIFFFRMELCILGVHTPSMAGIDYMAMKRMDEEPMAISIVSSGGYDDDGDNTDVLVYSGHGGVARKDGLMFDQKLERGNLALEKSLHRANDVRVIRGMKDAIGASSRIYVYDGLYKIKESWTEKNKSGCIVFKYKLIRVPGQPEAFSVWKSIQQWKDGAAIRPGVILPDLTSGAESQPVTLVNDVDGEKGPSHFSYIPKLNYSKPFPASNPSSGCHCLGGCQPGDINCPCLSKNEGLLPYSSIGVLLTNKPLIHECGQACSCPPNCRNRMSQAGLKVHLEVFKTENRGWGLRSWDPIRAGGFICEYAGDVVKEFTSRNGKDDTYIFDATRYYEPLEAVHDESAGFRKSPHPLCINANNNGNVARFMNHSCSPNVIWQPVLREVNSDSYLHVAFFAIRHIPPMQELTYDYGIVPPEKGGDKWKKKCMCGSAACRGYFY